MRSILLSVLFQEATHFLWVRMSGKKINMARDNALSVGENEINIPGSTQFRIRRTTCGENGQKRDQHGCWFSFQEMTHDLGENEQK